MEKIKKCSVCKKELPFSAFGIDRKNKYGLRSNCKACKSKADKIYAANIRKKIKKYADMEQKNAFLLTQNAELVRRLHDMERYYLASVKNVAALYAVLRRRDREREVNIT